MIDQVKLEHFRNLVSLAGADGIIQESERVALSKIAFELGMQLDRMNVMLNHSQEYTYLIPQNRENRDKQMQDMIELAMVDGELAKAELELIKTVGEKLGYNNEEVEKLIKIKLDDYA